MSALEKLTSCAGSWQGTTRLHDPITGLPEDSASLLIITQVTGGALQIDYTWSYQGMPQQGTLTSWEEAPGQVVTVWKDTWHTDVEMRLSGVKEEDNRISFLGSYAAPPGPDWGWRIVLEPGNSFHLRMFNGLPGGPEEIAVEATYGKIAGTTVM